VSFSQNHVGQSTGALELSPLVEDVDLSDTAGLLFLSLLIHVIDGTEKLRPFVWNVLHVYDLSHCVYLAVWYWERQHGREGGQGGCCVAYKVSVVARSQTTGTIIIGQRALFREGVAALLKHTPYKIIATAQRPSELKEVRPPAGSRPLIILGVDDATEGASEASANIRALRSQIPGSTIVVIAETHTPVNFQQILMAAPDGYVANLSSRDVLLRLLEVALLDQQVIVLSRPSSSSSPADEGDLTKPTSSGNHDNTYDLQYSAARHGNDRDPRLSQREREILFRLAEGDSNKQIARLCNITESTVKVHLKAILRKITVHNRTQAAIWAIAKGYRALPEAIYHAPKPANSDQSNAEQQRPSTNGKSAAVAVSGK
jgi:two-component system nitrate/nitrite response regulator NarL